MHFPNPFHVPSFDKSPGILLGLILLALAPLDAQPLRPWSVRLDLLDIDGAGRLNQRHLQHWAKRTVACCFDAAWLPWNPSEGAFQMGGGINVGGWVQDMEDGPHTRVADLLVEASARWSMPGSAGAPWARLDAGPALLVVERRQVGVDWGVGGAVQAGWAFAGATTDVLVGAGVDFRRYANLVVADLPALTVSVGVGL